MQTLESFIINRYLRTHDNLNDPIPTQQDWLTSSVNRELQRRGLDASAIVTIEMRPCLHDALAVVYYKRNASTKGCGCCHECGSKLSKPSHVGPSLEWCSNCEQVRNYRSHGGNASGDLGPCPKNNFREVKHV